MHRRTDSSSCKLSVSLRLSSENPTSNFLVRTTDFLLFPHRWIHSRIMVPHNSPRVESKTAWRVDVDRNRTWLLQPLSSVQFSSVTQSCPTLCDPLDCSTPGFLVHHQLPELTQTYIHRVGDAIQPSHPLLSSSPPAFNLSQHQGLFRWVSSSQQVAKVLEFQLQHQSFQWIFSTDLL